MALTTTVKTELYRFFSIAFNAAPGVTYMNQLAEASDAGMSVKQIVEVFTNKPQFTSVYPKFLTNEEFGVKLVENVVGSSASSGAKAEAADQVTSALKAGWSRGEVIYQIFTNLAGLTGDATWGGTAAQLDNKVKYAQYFTETLMRDTTDLPTLQAVIANVTATSGTSADDLAAALNPQSMIYALTSGIDTATANTFTSVPVYTPAGNAFINSLQDEDVLTGRGTNPTLNATLGTPNDKAESLVVPTLNGIQTVNLSISAGTADPATNTAGQGIGFQDSTGLAELNILRLTVNTGATSMVDLPASASKLSVSNATSAGAVTFTYREEVLTGTAEALSLDLKSARMATLNVNEVGTGTADTGFFFETVNVNTSGSVDIDTVNIGANGQEDTAANRTADTTKQVLNLTVADRTAELNNLNIPGVDTLNIKANGALVIATNANGPVSTAGGAANGLNASVAGVSGLEGVVVVEGAGNVRIDDVDLQAVTAAQAAAGVTRAINASALTGNLRLGLEAGASGIAQLVVTSGTGADEIRFGGALNGSVTTGAGNDTVGGGTGFATQNMGATASVSSGDGDDAVVMGTMTAQGDNRGARTNDQANDRGSMVSTGAGNDTVQVSSLATSADSYNPGKDNDGNADDTYFKVGPSVATGDGNDVVTIGVTGTAPLVVPAVAAVAGTLAEGAIVDTGAGDDTLTVEQAGATILAADTDANRVLGATGVLGLAVDNREVSATDPTKLDTVGAIIELGDGDDNVNFTDTTSLNDEVTALVGVDAEIRAGVGTDVLRVTALDITTVTQATAYTSATVNDINANITGVESAVFTIANQVTTANDTVNDAGASVVVGGVTVPAAGANTTNQGYAGSPTINDNSVLGASITADMLRFDSALKTVALDSQEQPLLRVATQDYEQGSATTFTVNNLAAGVTVSLKAQEASGVATAAGAAGVASFTGVLRDDITTDVTVNLNLAATAARGRDDALTFNIVEGSGAFDIALNLGFSATDTVLAATSSTDDDNMRVEKLTIGLASDDKGHAIALGSFGDATYTVGATAYTQNTGTFAQWRNTPGNQDGSVTTYNALSTAAKQAFGQGNNAATEFTLGSATAGTVAGTTSVVTGLSADKITLNGAGAVSMTVNAANNYTIVSGTGADTFNMVSDTVDDEDAIDGGATGRNTLVINGNNSIGFATASQPENDDAWTNKKNLQVLEIRANSNAVPPVANTNTNTVVLDEQTFVTGIDTINLTSTAAANLSSQTTTIVFGDDFRRDTTISTTDDIVSTVLNITNRVSAVDTTQTLTLFANGGAGLVLNDLYGRSKIVTTLTVNDLGGTTTISSAAAAATDGNVDIDVAAGTTGTISSITLVDRNQAAGALPAGTSLDTGAITVTVDNAWSRNAFTFDASAIDNAVVVGGTAAQTTAALADGGLTFNGAAELDAVLTVRGTGNSDVITGGAVGDVLSGNAGNDNIDGGLGNDNVSGGDGNDTLLGGAGADTLDAGAGTDSITGGAGADAMSGGDGADTYNYAAVTESTGGAADSISDFASGTDKISITATVPAGSTVNLGRFNPSGDSTSLDQTRFDAFYGNGALAIDVNGDGQINDNVDYLIRSTASIAAGDVNYTLTLGNAANTVRLGQGVDVITGGTANDTFVVVGAISNAQASAYATAGAGLIPAGLSAVLPLGDLTTFRTTNEATTGDSINGGAGVDTLHVYGALDLTGTTLTSIENLIVNSDVTLTPVQLASIGSLTFNGDSAHTLRIVVPAVITGGIVTTPAQVFTPSQVNTFLSGGVPTGVTGVTPLAAPLPVVVTNNGLNTTVTLGTGTVAEPVKSLPVADFAASTGIAVTNLSDSFTGYTATQVNSISSNLSKYADNGLTGALSFSTDITNLSTLLNSLKVDNTKTSVVGTSGNDTINLSAVTRGLTVDGGLGNDVITSTQGKDTINLGGGNDTLVLTAATTGSVTLGATVNIATIDRVSNFGSGDTLQLPFVPSMVSGSTATGTVIGVIRGSTVGDVFTPGTGSDYLFVYDADGSGDGTELDAVLLVGYTPSTTGATGGTGSTGTFGG